METKRKPVRPDERNIRIKAKVYKKLKIYAAQKGTTLSKALDLLLA